MSHMSVLDRFSPPVRAWFAETFGEPTPPQVQGWPAIQRGDHTLILAPTGSGKTLAAFLWGIDDLLRELQDPAAAQSPGIRVVYISPLKALNNDIHRNLRVPLTGIRNLAQELGVELPRIEVAVRSGDTPQKERQSMLRRPPHILITTPESFYLMLTGTRTREIFRRVRTVIVDEIHTLAGNKRGVHLSLSLERLQQVAEGAIQRIGLSATIRPLEEAARFLGGNDLIPRLQAQRAQRDQQRVSSAGTGDAVLCPRQPGHLGLELGHLRPHDEALALDDAQDRGQDGILDALVLGDKVKQRDIHWTSPRKADGTATRR